MSVYPNKDFDEQIKEGLFLIDFYAEWCGPCKMMAPIIESIEKDINVIKVNIDDYSDLASKYRIMSIPTIVIVKNGVVKSELVGFRSKEELLEVIKNIEE